MSADSDIQLWLSLSGSCPWALLGLWGCQSSGCALCAAELCQCLLPAEPQQPPALLESKQGGCPSKRSSGFILGHSLGEMLCQGLQAPAFPSAMGGMLQSEGSSSLPCSLAL